MRLLLAGDLETKNRELSDLQEVLKQRDEKLAEAQKVQAELVRGRTTHVNGSDHRTRVQESLDNVRNKARLEAEELLPLKVAEKETTITAMQRQMRTSSEGPSRAPNNSKVKSKRVKGEHGGDVIQRVTGPLGQHCGTILWESKRTKNWSDGWLPKLRDDQRAAKADIALIVTQALPKDVDSFNLIDGVWVTSPRYAMHLAIALRQSLIEVAAARKAGEGQQTKMEMLYQYLTGPRFRHRIEAIVEKFADMHDDLEKERKAMTRLWAKREAQNSMRRRVHRWHVRRPAGNCGQDPPRNRGARSEAPCSGGQFRVTTEFRWVRVSCLEFLERSAYTGWVRRPARPMPTGRPHVPTLSSAAPSVERTWLDVPRTVK